ncbi:PSAN1 [Auxenochlorella protothecoides x Auxenochlorella symbiontica]
MMSRIASTRHVGTCELSRVPGDTACRRGSRLVCHASLQSRRGMMGAAILLSGSMILSPLARADLTSDLLARSEANKELNDKKRLATSYANLARSRTVSDGTCKFPKNIIGCDLGPYQGEVKYIADDLALECQGKAPGECNSDVNLPVLKLK